MTTLGTTVKRTLGILALAAMIPASGFAVDGPRDGGKSMGPPQEAIDACAGRSEGETVRFTTPRGDAVSGICREIRGGLIAVPEGGFRGRHGGMGSGKHLARISRELNLTDDQRKQIRAILEDERQKAAPLRKQLAENRDKIRKAIEAEPYDEAAVRALAAGQSQARIELLVSRARVRNRIFAVLTPEQRDLAKKLRPWGKGRHEHHPGM